MSGMETAVQTAVFGALNQGILAGIVFDQRPQEITTFQSVNIGEDVSTEWDTDDSVGGSFVVRIDTWSRTGGMKETKELQAAIYDALHRATLTQAGWIFVGCNFIQSRSMVEPDGKTRHGVSEFRILIERE